MNKRTKVEGRVPVPPITIIGFFSLNYQCLNNYFNIDKNLIFVQLPTVFVL